MGIFKTLTQNVINYVNYDDWNSNQLQLNGDNIPDLASYTRVPLEQGKAYRFRVAGINAVGLGEHSEVRIISNSPNSTLVNLITITAIII